MGSNKVVAFRSVKRYPVGIVVVKSKDNSCSAHVVVFAIELIFIHHYLCWWGCSAPSFKGSPVLPTFPRDPVSLLIVFKLTHQFSAPSRGAWVVIPTLGAVSNIEVILDPVKAVHGCIAFLGRGLAPSSGVVLNLLSDQ